MLNFEEYYNFYKTKNFFPDGQYNNKEKKLNENQVKIKYDKYVKSLDRKHNKQIEQIEKQKLKNKEIIENKLYIDEQWEDVKVEVYKRDCNQCQLYNRVVTYLSDEDLNSLNYNKHLSVVDPCHVFGKGSYPQLKYDIENIILLYRMFHSRLDTYRDPITDKPLTREQHEKWWRYIVGDSRYDKLLNKLKK